MWDLFVNNLLILFYFLPAKRWYFNFVITDSEDVVIQKYHTDFLSVLTPKVLHYLIFLRV